MAQRKVTAIPATINKFTATPVNSRKKRRVAGYARVSTDHEDQVTSYAAQVDYYTIISKAERTGSLLGYTRTKVSLQPTPKNEMASNVWWRMPWQVKSTLS